MGRGGGGGGSMFHKVMMYLVDENEIQPTLELVIILYMG